MNLICKVSELLLAARLKRHSLFFGKEAQFLASLLLRSHLEGFSTFVRFWFNIFITIISNYCTSSNFFSYSTQPRFQTQLGFFPYFRDFTPKNAYNSKSNALSVFIHLDLVVR